MLDFLTNALVPLVKVLFVPFDLALGWVTLLGAIPALVVVGAITGLAVNFFQKYCSNQELLGRRRADLEKLKSLLRDAKNSNDADKAARVSSLTSLISSKYALESFKPALYSVPPLCILAMWVGARLSFEPVRPGENIEVVGTFEDGASGFAYFVPNEGLASNGSPIVPITLRKSAAVADTDTSPEESLVAADTTAPRNRSANVAMAPAPTATPVVETTAAPQARWKIRAEKDGVYPLQIRHGEDRYNLTVPISVNGGLPPEQATVFRTESPTRDRLLSLEFKLREPIPVAWWNFKLQAMGVYLIAAMAFGIALRRVMGIQ